MSSWYAAARTSGEGLALEARLESRTAEVLAVIAQPESPTSADSASPSAYPLSAMAVAFPGVPGPRGLPPDDSSPPMRVRKRPEKVQSTHRGSGRRQKDPVGVRLAGRRDGRDDARGGRGQGAHARKSA